MNLCSNSSLKWIWRASHSRLISGNGKQQEKQNMTMTKTQMFSVETLKGKNHESPLTPNIITFSRCLYKSQGHYLESSSPQPTDIQRERKRKQNKANAKPGLCWAIDLHKSDSQIVHYTSSISTVHSRSSLLTSVHSLLYFCTHVWYIPLGFLHAYIYVCIYIYVPSRLQWPLVGSAPNRL